MATSGPSGAESPSPGRPSNSLHFVVGEMSGKLDQLLAAILTDRASNERRFGEHEDRITVLERWQWRLVGGGSVIVFLISAVEVWRGTGGR